MLSDPQRKRVAQALRAAPDERRTILATLSPLELHAFARHSPLDTGLDDLRAIAADSRCDRGTALMLYWRTDGIFGKRRNEVAEHERELYNLAVAIEQRYLTGFYTGQQVRFDPCDRADTGNDWRVMVAGATRDIPEEMFHASPGKYPSAAF